MSIFLLSLSFISWLTLCCLSLGTRKAYTGSDRDMSGGKRPSIIQHCHPQTLWRGEHLETIVIASRKKLCHSCCTHSVYLYIIVSFVPVIIIIQLWIKALESLFFVTPDLLLISLQVFALICDAENPQVFTVEFIRGQIRRFSSTERYTSLTLLLVFMTPWVFVFQPHLLAIFHFSTVFTR